MPERAVVQHHHAPDRPDTRVAFELWMTCSDCGDVVVRAELCELHVDRVSNRHTVAYPCPECHRRDVVEVNADDVAELVEAGFVVRTIERAAELAEFRPSGTPFTWDDLLSFHEQLAGVHDVAARAGPRAYSS